MGLGMISSVSHISLTKLPPLHFSRDMALLSDHNAVISSINTMVVIFHIGVSC